MRTRTSSRRHEIITSFMRPSPPLLFDSAWAGTLGRAGRRPGGGCVAARATRGGRALHVRNRAASSSERIIVPGKFDALHLGHRALLLRAAERGRPVLLSFSGMAEALGWEARLPIVPRAHMEQVVRSWLGDDADAFDAVVLPFAEVRQLSPRAFLQEYVVRRLDAAGVVCGANWRFGHRAQGDVQTLLAFAEECIRDGRPFTVDALSPVLYGGERVSSTRVRECLARGDMEEVAGLLGRPYQVHGAVQVIGIEERGMEARVAGWENQPPVAPGWYAARAMVEAETRDGTAPAAISVMVHMQPVHADANGTADGAFSRNTPRRLRLHIPTEAAAAWQALRPQLTVNGPVRVALELSQRVSPAAQELPADPMAAPKVAYPQR